MGAIQFHGEQPGTILAAICVIVLGVLWLVGGLEPTAPPERPERAATPDAPVDASPPAEPAPEPLPPREPPISREAAASDVSTLSLQVCDARGHAVDRARIRVDEFEVGRSSPDPLLVDVEPGRREVSVRWRNCSTTTTVLARPGRIESVVLVVDPPRLLSGRVVDDRTGQGVEGALVEVNGFRARTKPGGSFALPYPMDEPFDRQVFAGAQHANYWPTEKLVWLRADDDSEIELRLRRGDATLVVEVVNEAGAGLPRLEVEVGGPRGRTLATNAEGKARFDGLPAGEYSIRVKRAGQRHDRVRVGEKGSVLHRVTLPMRPCHLTAPPHCGVLLRNPMTWEEVLPGAGERSGDLSLPEGPVEFQLLRDERVVARLRFPDVPPQVDLAYEPAPDLHLSIRVDEAQDVGGLGLEPVSYAPTDAGHLPARVLVDPAKPVVRGLLRGQWRVLPPPGFKLVGNDRLSLLGDEPVHFEVRLVPDR